MKKLILILALPILLACQADEKVIIKTDKEIVTEFVAKIIEVSPTWIYTGQGYAHDMYLKVEFVEGERISFAHFFPRNNSDCWGSFVLKDYSLIGTVLQDTDTFLEVETSNGTIEIERIDNVLIFIKYVEGTQTVGGEYVLSNIDYNSLNLCI